MHPLTHEQIRSSFVNTTLRERKAIPLPAQLDTLDWSAVEYLGWRDPKQPLLGFVVTEVDGAPLGVMLRRVDRPGRVQAQCAWCEDVELRHEVVFFSARRAGDAGRRGDTVGTLVCAGFECPSNVRRRPAMAYLGFDVEAERQRRIAALAVNVTEFVRRVAADS